MTHPNAPRENSNSYPRRYANSARNEIQRAEPLPEKILHRLTPIGIDNDQWCGGLAKAMFPEVWQRKDAQELMASAIAVAAWYNILPECLTGGVFYIGEFGGRLSLIPGIRFLRIQAHRSGTFLGVRVEHSAELTTINSRQCPVSATATITRELNGHRAEFSHTSYASEVNMGNAKWKQMPRHMLGVRAEATALRMAYPEVISADPERSLRVVVPDAADKAPLIVPAEGVDAPALNANQDIQNKVANLTGAPVAQPQVIDAETVAPPPQPTPTPAPAQQQAPEPEPEPEPAPEPAPPPKPKRPAGRPNAKKAAPPPQPAPEQQEAPEPEPAAPSLADDTPNFGV